MTRRALPVALLVLHLAALWPVAAWSVARVADRGGSLWGLVPLAVAVALLARRRVEAPLRLGLPSAALVAYVVAWQVAPPLVAAAFGAVSVAALASTWRLGRRLDPAVAGLLLLALPDISTLQVFVGWPFRTAIASVVAGGLSTIGVDVARQGTLLVIDGQAVAVDAACSGVWMGWGAVLAWWTLALARRLPPRATWLGTVALVPLVFAANALRTSSLGLAAARVELPAWAHEGVGLVAFAAVAAAVVMLAERLSQQERRSPCAAPSSI